MISKTSRKTPKYFSQDTYRKLVHAAQKPYLGTLSRLKTHLPAQLPDEHPGYLPNHTATSLSTTIQTICQDAVPIPHRNGHRNGHTNGQTNGQTNGDESICIVCRRPFTSPGDSVRLTWDIYCHVCYTDPNGRVAIRCSSCNGTGTGCPTCRGTGVYCETCRNTGRVGTRFQQMICIGLMADGSHRPHAAST